MTPADDRAAPTTPTLHTVLAGRRVVLCLGSGGVGKTTTSAALAVALARAGERVVVLTIDPARRLADALGLGGALSNTPTLVAGLDDVGTPTADGPGPDPTEGEVWAAMLDPAETFRGVIEAEATSVEQAERILNNRLFASLTTTLSGTNEYMAAERLHQLAGDDRFDRIIVDTPPSHHALDFLDSPGRLARFVDHRLYRSVLAPRHGLLRPLNLGARAVMRLLAGLVGGALVDDVVAFFADFEVLDQGFRRRAGEIDALLAGSSAAYVVVTTPRSDRLAEAAWITDNLERRRRRPAALIVNRTLDLVAPRPDDQRATESLAGPLRENLTQLAALAAHQSSSLAPLVARVQGDELTPSAAIVRLPEQELPVRDLTGLTILSNHLS